MIKKIWEKLSLVSKIFITIWSVIFIVLVVTFVIVDKKSKGRIFEATLEIKAENKLENGLNLYEARLRFPSAIFRAQKNISKINIMGGGILIL